ncbi:phospholipase A [Kangiella sediminilitoris]|uniref:Phospholipase A1 n=1 Tax=Kangiella sediminilitoris TaxID=1144748 RepID=A0A1B3BCN9_9GAMM|nr:phospholipase A [Kangiella sediminilitoris]AOE50562.1 Phospholipase A(1) [Kangiella sediminilitoris]
MTFDVKPNRATVYTILLPSLLMAPVLSLASEEEEASSAAYSQDYDQCLLQRMDVVSDDTSIKEIKEYCERESDRAFFRRSKDLFASDPADSEDASGQAEGESEESTLLKKRLRLEYRIRDNRFAIIPHKPNYLLPLTYNRRPNEDSLQATGDEREVDNTEIKFQVSFKTPFWEEPFGKDSALFFAYTGQSYWQAYNKDVSSPFRETNHEPEIFAAWATDWALGEWQIPYFSMGVSHQSNGQSGLYSRSWNRVYTEFAFENDRWVIAFKPWWRIPEDEKEDPLDPDGDDNPDIDDYMGYFELYSAYQWDDHNFGVLLRNNLRSDNKGAVQFDWTFPLDDDGKLRGYIQYFNGYGESLIDYNRHVNRLGVGFVLTDWL